jgi:general secretion pathway protein B
MSYILDALRKADAQRERDPARGIHAQPTRASTGAAGDAGRPDRKWLWIVAGALVIAVLAWAGWMFFAVRPDTVPARVELARAPVAAPPATMRTPTPVAPPVANAVMPPPPPVEIKAAEPVNRPPPPVDTRNTSQPNPRGNPMAVPSPGAPATPPVPAQNAAPSGPAAPAAPAMPPVSSPPAPLPAAPAAATPAPATAPVAGLPADAPKVTISGGVYSTAAAQRMLIVNGQVVNEGAELAPGLVLEEIRPKAAVLKFRGARYTVTY